MKILALDVGTTETGWCIMDMDEPRIINFGKHANETVIWLVHSVCNEKDVDEVVYEQFESFGMPIGQSTMTSIWWNGRMYEMADLYAYRIKPITRKQEKLNLCGSTKAKDCNIRQALIDRFGEVGTKKNPGFFYGVSKDVWSAIAIAVTYYDLEVNK